MSNAEPRADAYETWLAAILDRHQNRRWDGPEDDEDPRLEEEWERLPTQLRKRIWGLSADLFSLTDEERFVDSDDEPLTKQELAERMKGAFDRREWDALLELRRRPPRFVPPDQVAYLRGRAWQELGQPSIALRFFDNAYLLKPGHVPYLILGLESLKAAGDWPEAIRRANTYGADPSSSPTLLFRAADTLHAYAASGAGEDFFARSVDLIDRGFRVLPRQEGAAPESTVIAAFATKAFSLERLGRIADALTTYDDALRRFPDHPELLTARGLLRLEGGDEAAAAADFNRAVTGGARVVWPYLELARISCRRHDYALAAELCRQGLRRVTADRPAARLYELLAISQLRLNGSTDAVEQAFQKATELDPFNLTIRKNHALFRGEREGEGRAAEEDWEVTAPSPADTRREWFVSLRPASALAA